MESDAAPSVAIPVTVGAASITKGSVRMGLVASLPPKEFPIPHEPGNFMSFKKPAQYVVRDARNKVAKEGRLNARDLGGEIFSALTTGRKEDEAEKFARIQRLQDATRYDPDNFDRDTLLNAAVAGWSGPEYMRDGKPVPVSEEEIAGMDEPTADWAHKTIVALIKPKSPEESKSDAEGGRSGD